MTSTSLACKEQITSPAWTPAAACLLDAMQRGVLLHWTPYGGFVLHMASGRTCKPPLSAVWPLQRAGLITTTDHDWTATRVWRVMV